MADYITISEADDFAAVHLNAAAWIATSTPRKAAAIAQATLDIDGMRFQGSRWQAGQERAFPRYVGDGSAQVARYLNSDVASWADFVWDWDSDTNTAVVPDLVKRACFEQALSLLGDTQRNERLKAQADGVIAQSAGGVSETYRPDGRPSNLCMNARTLLAQYRLRTGSMV